MKTNPPIPKKRTNRVDLRTNRVGSQTGPVHSENDPRWLTTPFQIDATQGPMQQGWVAMIVFRNAREMDAMIGNWGQPTQENDDSKHHQFL